MVVEQTVDIPVNHRLFLDVPPEMPAGRTRVRLDTGQSDGHNVDSFLAWKYVERELEWEREQRHEEEHRLWRER